MITNPETESALPNCKERLNLRGFLHFDRELFVDFLHFGRVFHGCTESSGGTTFQMIEKVVIVDDINLLNL